MEDKDKIFKALENNYDSVELLSKKEGFIFHDNGEVKTAHLRSDKFDDPFVYPEPHYCLYESREAAKYAYGQWMRDEILELEKKIKRIQDKQKKLQKKYREGYET